MTSPTRASVVGLDGGDRAVLYVGAPLVGLGLGWALPRVADWADRQAWVPFQGPVRLIASWDGGWVPVAFLVVGALAGVLLAAYAVWETLQVILTDDEVVLAAKGRSDVFARADVTAVFVDGKHLVLLGDGTRELVRREHGSKPPQLAQAFRQHGYPWLDADPHADDFLRWVPDLPGVTPAASALLAARATALEKKQTDEADDLRAQLARLGYVVRDEKTRQYWRTAS